MGKNDILEVYIAAVKLSPMAEHLFWGKREG